MTSKAHLTLLVIVAVGSTGCYLRRDTHERLNAVLWIQSSAEYRVLASGTYREAQARIEQMLIDLSFGNPVSSAALEQSGADAINLPPAVILDIDETILDNSPMSGRLIGARSGYNREVWADWVNKREAGFIDGAREFIDWLRSRNIEVFLVTNRTAGEEMDTIEDLLPIVIADEMLLASNELGEDETVPWESEKSARRAYVAKTHFILALIGDDLADFVPGIRKMRPEDRVTAARAHMDRFNRNWFLLPNPVYGSWETVLYDATKADKEQLKAKRALVRGYE